MSQSESISAAELEKRRNQRRTPGPDESTCPECRCVITETSTGREIGHERGASGDREMCPRHPDYDGDRQPTQTALGGDW